MKESTHESSEVVAGTISTSSVDDLLRHWVTVKEPRKDGQAETKVKMSCNNVVACRTRTGQASQITIPIRYYVPTRPTLTSKSRAAQTSTRLFFT